MKEQIEKLIFELRFETHNNRIAEVFDFFSKFKFGNCVEIGAGYGETTVPILKKLTTNKIIVVDPFEKIDDTVPDSYVLPYPLQKFETNVSFAREKVFLIQKPSNNITVKEEIEKFNPIVFSFVDGLQYKKNVIEDLNLMSELGVDLICIDDYNRLTDVSQVPLAVETFLDTNKKYSSIYYNNLREIYLIKNEKN